MSQPHASDLFLDQADLSFHLTAEQWGKIFGPFDPAVVEQLLQYVHPAHRETLFQTFFALEHYPQEAEAVSLGFPEDRPEILALVHRLAGGMPDTGEAAS